MSSKGVKTRNPRDFTVRIMDADHKNTFGTGMIYPGNGDVITCAHVIKAVLDVHPRDAGELEVGVKFPQADASERNTRRAVRNLISKLRRATK